MRGFSRLNLCLLVSKPWYCNAVLEEMLNLVAYQHIPAQKGIFNRYATDFISVIFASKDKENILKNFRPPTGRDEMNMETCKHTLMAPYCQEDLLHSPQSLESY